MATSLEFKIPADPSPMPTMGSDDEESFVVLSKSLIPDVDLSFRDLHIEPVQSGPIEEGKKLINMELSQLDTSMLPQMPDVAQQINDADMTISVTTISCELSPEEVQRKVDTVIAENIKLRDTIITNNTAMEMQHERIIAWKEEVQKTHQAHKLKFAEAKEFITKLKSEKDLLTFELEKSNEIRGMQQVELLKLKADLAGKKMLPNGIDAPSISTTGENNAQKELNDAKIKIMELERLLQIIHVAKDKVAAENEELKFNKLSLSNAEKIIQDLKNEIEEKNKTIEELKDKLKNREESSSNTIRTLNTEVINLRSQLCLNINLQEDLDNVRKQLMASQASITALQQTNSVLSAEFTAEQEKVKELKKVETLKDDYFALQQQIEIYKADFRAEQEAKDILKAEKEQIISDFLQIQKRNNELNEELELIKERGFEVIERRGNFNSLRSPNTSSESSQGKHPYTCPICNFGFTAYQALENHVERCMDLSASLP